ncbi:MAG TPA: hypothetical protein PKE69_18875 [Pyrinomonadaceae bacterium]|nr:hypothetical protein [Pyrinomonadaceae bacterium]
MSNQTNFNKIEKSHSRLGVASFLVSVILPILMTVFSIITFSIDTKRNSVGSDIVLILLVISLTFPILHFVGLTLGIAGIFVKTKKRLFAVIGTILNAVLLLVGIGLVYLAFIVFSAAAVVR